MIFSLTHLAVGRLEVWPYVCLSECAKKKLSEGNFRKSRTRFTKFQMIVAILPSNWQPPLTSAVGAIFA